MSTNLLQIENLFFSYKKNIPPVINNFNIKINGKEIVGIYGKNGSGKTTLLNCISGYCNIKQGKILLNQSDINQNRKNISIVDSNMDLFDYLNIEDNIKYFLMFYRKQLIQRDVDVYLERYNISTCRNKYIAEASKGMIKKTQIIISLLLNPILLLADEPTDSLDKGSQDVFFEDIKILAKNGGIVIFSLHDLNKLKQICNRIIYL